MPFACAQQALTLHDAIAEAQRSPQARQGQDLVDAAHGLVTQAGLRPNPRLYLQSEDLRPWASDFDFPNATEDYAYLAQIFELGGKRGSRLGLARANVRQVEAERTLAMRAIAGRVAAAYWAAVASEGIAALLEDDLQAVNGIVLYNQRRVDAGAMRGVDLLRVQIERDRLLLALEIARRDSTSARIELFKQIGRAVGPPSSVNAIKLTDYLGASTPIQTEAIETILATRADVIAARAAVTAAQADLKFQHSMAVPDVDIFGGYKRNAANNTLYTNLQIPLPFRNRNQGEIERSQAGLRLNQDRLLQLELSVRADVQSAEDAYTRQQRVVREILPDMRARARQNLAIMDDAYRSGGVDLLRYLDAQRTEFDVEVSALRTLADFQQASLRLQLVYGAQP